MLLNSGGVREGGHLALNPINLAWKLADGVSYSIWGVNVSIQTNKDNVNYLALQNYLCTTSKRY